MDQSQIISKLEPIFQEVFDMPELKLNGAMNAADVEGWDSLAHIRLVVTVEQSLGVQFSTAEISELKNVGEFADLIRSKINS
jgi:acyl carrier protein